MPPYNGFNPAQIIQDYIVTVDNTARITMQMGVGAVALADDLEALAGDLEALKTVVDELSLKLSSIVTDFVGTMAELNEAIEDLPVNTTVFLSDDEQDSTSEIGG